MIACPSLDHRLINRIESSDDALRMLQKGVECVGWGRGRGCVGESRERWDGVGIGPNQHKQKQTLSFVTVQMFGHPCIRIPTTNAISLYRHFIVNSLIHRLSIIHNNFMWRLLWQVLRFVDRRENMTSPMMMILTLSTSRFSPIILYP